MPIDPSISLQVQPVDPAGMINKWADLGLKRNLLQRSNETLLSDIARSKAESSSAQTAANVASQTAPEIVSQQQEAAKQAKIRTELEQYHLTGEYSQKGQDIATSLIQDPDIQQGNGPNIIDKLVTAKQQAMSMGIPARNAEVMFSPLITMAATDPKAVQQRLAQIIKSGQPAPSQAAQSLLPVSGQVGMGPQTPGGLPTTVQRTETGGQPVQGVLPQAPQGAPQGPQAQQRRLLQYPPGENDATFKQLSGERDAGRQTVLQAPTIHRLNSEILSELDKATTGQYSSIIARGQSLAGMMGLSLTGNNDAERAASAYDLVDKYTTQAATRAAQSMGNDTATALNAQMKQNASVERNPTAIRKSIKFNDAVLSGAEAYQTGLEKSISNNPQSDVFAKRKFDQAWSQNFDPVIMQIYQAKKAGDNAELADLVKGLGARKDEIMQKATNLQILMRGM